MQGWLFVAEVATLVVLLALCYRPLGDHMARTYTTARDTRAERGLYRLLGVDPAAEQSWRNYLRSVIVFSIVGVLALYLLQRIQAVLPYSLGLPAVPEGLVVQHRDLVRDEHELAVVLARDHARLHRAARRARGAELRLGGGRPRRRHRPGARARGPPVVDDRELLGRPRPRGAAHPAAAVARRRDRADRGRRHPELLGGFQTSTPSPAARPSCRAARSPRRRRSRSSARTAAASSTPTPRIRSRTRAAWTNLFEILLLLVIPFCLPRTFGRDGRRQPAGLRAARRDGDALHRVAHRDGLLESAGGGTACRPRARRWRARRRGSASSTSTLFATSTTLTSTGAVDRRTTASRRSAA